VASRCYIASDGVTMAFNGMTRRSRPGVFPIMVPAHESRSAVVVLLIGILIGVVLAAAVGIGLALLRPESASVLRPWWR